MSNNGGVALYAQPLGSGIQVRALVHEVAGCHSHMVRRVPLSFVRLISRPSRRL